MRWGDEAEKREEREKRQRTCCMCAWLKYIVGLANFRARCQKLEPDDSEIRCREWTGSNWLCMCDLLPLFPVLYAKNPRVLGKTKRASLQATLHRLSQLGNKSHKPYALSSCLWDSSHAYPMTTPSFSYKSRFILCNTRDWIQGRI